MPTGHFNAIEVTANVLRSSGKSLVTVLHNLQSYVTTKRPMYCARAAFVIGVRLLPAGHPTASQACRVLRGRYRKAVCVAAIKLKA
jgi:hypothetical protein